MNDLDVSYNDITVSDSDGRSKGKSKVHPCTGTEALYGPYGL